MGIPPPSPALPLATDSCPGPGPFLKPSAERQANRPDQHTDLKVFHTSTQNHTLWMEVVVVVVVVVVVLGNSFNVVSECVICCVSPL